VYPQNVHLRKWQDVLFPFLQMLIEGQTSFRHSCSREGQRDAQYRVGAKFGFLGVPSRSLKTLIVVPWLADELCARGRLPETALVTSCVVTIALA
jgi:hypothetical protein